MVFAIGTGHGPFVHDGATITFDGFSFWYAMLASLAGTARTVAWRASR